MRPLAAFSLCLVLALPAFELGARGALWAWRLAYRACARDDAFALYVVGESTAYGEPYAPAIDFPTLVSTLLGGSVGGRPIEIVNLAFPGSSTEAEYWELWKELAARPRRRGALLVYAGINEAQREPTPSLWERLAGRSLLLSRASWVARGSRGRGLALDYGRRIEKLVALARGAGYPVVVSTLVGNLRDFQPDVTPALKEDAARWAAYARARRDEALGRWEPALSAYETLAREADEPALAHHRALCLLALGRRSEALPLFQAAADAGGTKRPMTSQQDALRRVAERPGVALADAQAAFAAASPDGAPGDELFSDAHHPNLRGYLLLARTFALALSPLVGQPLARGEISEREALERAGLSRRALAEVDASRVVWNCGEASYRVDPSGPVEAARRRLALAERGFGRPLPAYRFLVALAARDRAAVARLLAEPEEIEGDAKVGSIACHPYWADDLVERAGLEPGLERRARDLIAESRRACGR